MGSGINAPHRLQGSQPLVVILIVYRADLSWLWRGIRKRELSGGVDQPKDVINHHISVISWTWPSVSSSEANWLWACYTHTHTHTHTHKQTNTQAIWWEEPLTKWGQEKKNKPLWIKNYMSKHTSPALIFWQFFPYTINVS